MLENVVLKGFTAFEYGGGHRITLEGRWCDGSPMHFDHFGGDDKFLVGLFVICGYAYM